MRQSTWREPQDSTKKSPAWSWSPQQIQGEDHPITMPSDDLQRPVARRQAPDRRARHPPGLRAAAGSAIINISRGSPAPRHLLPTPWRGDCIPPCGSARRPGGYDRVPAGSGQIPASMFSISSPPDVGFKPCRMGRASDEGAPCSCRSTLRARLLVYFLFGVALSLFLWDRRRPPHVCPARPAPPALPPRLRGNAGSGRSRGSCVHRGMIAWNRLQTATTESRPDHPPAYYRQRAEEQLAALRPRPMRWRSWPSTAEVDRHPDALPVFGQGEYWPTVRERREDFREIYTEYAQGRLVLPGARLAQMSRPGSSRSARGGGVRRLCRRHLPAIRRSRTSGRASAASRSACFRRRLASLAEPGAALKADRPRSASRRRRSTC